MESKKCVWINPERLETAQLQGVKEVEGIDLTVSLSPYDLPSAIIGEYEQEAKDFVISLEYMDDEPRRLAHTNAEGIHAYVGKYSGKILRISIPIDHPPLDRAAFISLEPTFLHAIDEIDRAQPRARLNHRAAKYLIQTEFKNLVPT